MKKLVFILTLVICMQGFEVRSQEWAPDGAEWYYDYENFWYTGYVHITVLGDTVINDTNCRILNRLSVTYNHLSDTTTTFDHGDAYMYGDGDKVYLFENNKFYVLYDFTAGPGDTLIIPNNSILGGLGCDPEGEIVVTDTTTVLISGQELRKIQVVYTEESHWAIYGEIIETIGPVNHYMLPEPTYQCVVDLSEGGPLRCYSDPGFGLYNTGMAPECDYLVSVPEMSEFEIEIFPNPTNGILHIGIPNNRSSVFTLYDSKGQEVMHRHLAQSLNSFDLSDLRKGLYSVMLKFDNKAFKRLIVIQ